MNAEVVIDARWLHSGIGAYTLNVVGGIHRHPNGLVVRVLTGQKDEARIRPLCDRTTIVDVPIYTLREQWAVARAARGAGLLHVPHYNVPLLYPGKLVVTIYDLIHITGPTFHRSLASHFYARPMLHLASRKACHIVTLSYYSQAKIIERLGADPSKISVIYPGVGANFRSEDRAEARRSVSDRLSLARPYLLFVGNLKPHKNVGTLIRAFTLLRARKRLDHQLVLIGDDKKWKLKLVQECERLGIEKYVLFVPNVSDQLLPQVYAAADLLILPSFLEGFGLPIVEAMAAGTLVVCSRAASLPEVAGDAAQYFDPSSVEDLAAAIERVLESADLQATLRRKGLERSRQFSWGECARRHVQLYRHLLQA